MCLFNIYSVFCVLSKKSNLKNFTYKKEYSMILIQDSDISQEDTMSKIQYADKLNKQKIKEIIYKNATLILINIVYIRYLNRL